MKVNSYHIDRIVSAGYSRQLAAFILMKSKFSNSIYYNYSRNIVSKKCGGISGPNAGRYINFFLKNGWCSIQGSHLLFKGLKKVADMYIGLVTDMNPNGKFSRNAINLIKCKGKDINNILFQIRMTIVKNPYNQFKKSKQQSIELISPANINVFKAAKRYVNKYKISSYSEQSEYCVSVRTLSKRLCISPAGVVNFLRQAVEHKRCKIKKRPPRIKRIEGLSEATKNSFGMETSLGSYRFFKEGYAALFYCNVYEFR